MPSPPAKYTEQIVIMESPAVAVAIRATALTYGESVSEIMRRVIEHGLPVVQNELRKERPSDARKYGRELTMATAKQRARAAR